MTTLTQSARIPGPSWDETIVPALRKRLESESRTLAKRMSAVSITSLDERDAIALREAKPAYSSHNGQRLTAQKGQSPEPTPYRSENTPRANGSHSSSSRPPPGQIPRSRTYSQPYASKPPASAVNGKASGAKGSASKSAHLPTTAPSPELPTPPMPTKPTRIPKPRTRTNSASTGSASQQQPNRHINGFNHAPPSDPPDLYPVYESHSSSALINETAPFSASSNFSTNDTIYNPSPRTSSESEERPFEHWYRGEVSRNGGVGELRVGKRVEMLEIANYGHSLRQRSANSSRGATPTVGLGLGAEEASYDTRERSEWTRRRKRADSVSGILGDGRESLYLDEERAREVALVLDERPLTDLEDGTPDEEDYDDGEDTEVEDNTTQYNRNAYHAGDISTTSAPTSTMHQAERSMTPTSNSAKPRGMVSRIPTPSGARPSIDSHRVPSPELYRQPLQRGGSEPPPSTQNGSASAPGTPRAGRRQPSPTTPKVQPQPRKASGPAVNGKKGPSASARTRAKTQAAKQAAQEEANRKALAKYPTPDSDGDMADAIPTWTQPVPKTGNWDEVVLPVVARKKGLDDFYEQADGSPQPKRPPSMIAPAPGTFGYDHSKYRPPRGEAIPMDEFGQPASPVHEVDEDEQDTPGQGQRPAPVPGLPPPEGRVPLRQNPLDAPPFSQYTPAISQPLPLPQVTTAQPQSAFDDPRQKDEEDAGGCCKSCVIIYKSAFV
ncbi:hypothetical protein HGRIS_005947 [Hohenbuehelia grisea]|uniref:Uncharacterized protein n=1 Tax=Hohenbuehelia grisea TaxID=104357 RepID=A0ABR3JYM3_9AGAR